MPRVPLVSALLGLGLFAPCTSLAAQDHQPDRPVTPLCVSGCPATVSVTPDSGSVGVEANSGSHTVTFFVTNTSTTSGSYTLTCSAVKVTCGTVTPSAVTLPANGTIDVDVSFTVGSRAGTVTLTASGSATDAGMYAVAIVSPTAPTVVFQNQNGTNLDRGLCLTTGAGEAAGISCGDLFVTHGIPAYRTLGRDRSLTLIYNSATANGLVLVAANVSQPASTATPTSVTLVLTVGAAKDSAQFAAVPPGQTQQMVIGRGITGLATGVYPMILAVRNVYPGGVYETTVSGTVLVVNRSASEFGAGWALMGLEQVFTDPSDSTRRVWVAGDGSIRLYTQSVPGSSTFLAAAGDAPDSLVRFLNGGTLWYRRQLKHGVTVEFDQTGRHRTTTNRVGAITSFYWSAASPVRLDSINVPPNDAIRRTYRLFWHSGTALLDSIRDPGGRRLGLLLDGTGQLTRLTDPDNQATRFQYTSGRLTRRVYPRAGMKGDSAFTSYAYGGGGRVASVSIQTDSAATLFAVTTLTPWDERGLANPYPVFATGALVPPEGLATRVDGPIAGLGDATDIVVNRFGQPTRMVGLFGNTVTTIGYDSLGANPALPVLVQYPDATTAGVVGRVVRLTWNLRGNLLAQRDSTFWVDGQPTKVASYTYASATAPDSPTRVEDALGRHTDFAYTSQGLTDSLIDPRGHRTTYAYATGSTAGLVSAVTERSVETWVQQAGADSTLDQVTRFTYDTNGNPLTTTSPAGAVTSYVADSLGRITDVYDPLRTRTSEAYDGMNQLTTETAYTTPQNHPGGVSPLAGCVATQFLCADSTAPFRPALPATLLTRYAYTAWGAVDSVLDPRNVTRRYFYDARGNVWRERDDQGHDQVAYYNVNGLLDSVRTRSGFTTRFRYDGLGRRTATVFPARRSPFAGDTTVIPGDSLSSTYDLLGRVLTNRNQAGHVLTRTYYADGALRSKHTSYPLPSSTFSDSMIYQYDAAGARTLFVTADGDTTRYFYGATTGLLDSIRVRMSNSASNGAAAVRLFRFTYDALGRRRQIRYPVSNLTVNYSYDALGGLRRVQSSDNTTPTATDRFVFTFLSDSVDPIGRELHQQTTCYAYNSADTQMLPCGSAGSVRSLTNRYDRRGHLVLQLDGVQRDSLHYDASGNILYRYRSSGSTPGRDSIQMLPGSNRIQWDSNLVTHVRVNYMYDADGARLLESPTPNVAGNVTLWRWQYYDATGRNTGYRYATWNPNAPGQLDNWFHPSSCQYNPAGGVSHPCPSVAVWMSTDGANASKFLNGWRFVTAPGTDELLIARYALGGARRTLYFVMDGRGRQLAVGDSAGYLTANDLGDSDPGSWQYAGATQNGAGFDATRQGNANLPGVAYFRNRAYDARTGRWLQEDPLGVASGLNLYQFNGNNPVAYTDPFGLCPKDKGGDGKTDRLDDCPKDSKGWKEYQKAQEAEHAALQQCYEQNKFSSAMGNFSGSQGVANAVEVAETGSLISVGSDVVAIGLKATRSGVGGSSNPYASGINMVGRSIARGIGRAISGDPAVTGMLVRGVTAVGDKASPTLLLIGAGTAAYNTATDLQCRIGIIK